MELPSLMLVDDVIVADPPLPAPPRFEDVVGIYPSHSGVPLRGRWL